MDKEHLHNKIIREIFARAGDGQFAPGQRLPSERKLCQMFGVARGTLRKAMAELRSLGVVSVRANSGIYLREFSSRKLPHKYLPPQFNSVSISDVIVARKAIECSAVKLACERISAEKINELKTLIDTMESNIEDLPVFLQADMEFHQTLVAASGNMVLHTAFGAIYDYHRFSSYYTSKCEGQERDALEFHKKILDAIRKGLPKQAEKILAEHLDKIEDAAVPSPCGEK